MQMYCLLLLGIALSLSVSLCLFYFCVKAKIFIIKFSSDEKLALHAK